jgi:hypothetical protein
MREKNNTKDNVTNVYSPSYIKGRQTKSRGLRLAEYVKCMAGMIQAYTIFRENQEEITTWET